MSDEVAKLRRLLREMDGKMADLQQKHDSLVQAVETQRVELDAKVEAVRADVVTVQASIGTVAAPVSETGES